MDHQRFMPAKPLSSHSKGNHTSKVPIKEKNALVPIQVRTTSQFTNDIKGVEYLWEGILQKGYVYSATGKWGSGKTAIFLTIAIHIALGREIGDLRTKKSKVLYLAGENPSDVKLRVKAICGYFDIQEDDLNSQLFFTDKSFSIGDSIEEQMANITQQFGAFDFVVIDTAAAHSGVKDENSNTDMHKFAHACGQLGHSIGDACVLVLMHPPQGIIDKNSLRSRGAGSFPAQIDGELLLWQEQGTRQVELFQGQKFRGNGFKPMLFDLEKYAFPDIKDNFGNEASTVVARFTLEKRTAKKVDGETLKVLEALKLVQGVTGVDESAWRKSYYELPSRISKTKTTNQQAFRRGKEILMKALIVTLNNNDLYMGNEYGEE